MLSTSPDEVLACSRRSEPLPSLQDVSAMLADEIRSLSVKERDDVLCDIHGVPDFIVEKEPFVRTRLDQMRATLERMEVQHPSQLSAYNLAKSMDPNYLNARDFLLMFLRADFFDPEEAAQRLIRHISLKRELFGDDKLTKDITLEDLGQEEINELQSGFIEKLDTTDRSGRKVFRMTSLPQGESTVVMKILWYMGMSAVKDDETSQVRGLVALDCNIRDDHENCRHFGSTCNALPVRLICHYWYDDPALFETSLKLRYCLGRASRIRSRQFYGTQDQFHAQLKSFGIPAEVFRMRNLTEERMAFKAIAGQASVLPAKKSVAISKVAISSISSDRSSNQSSNGTEDFEISDCSSSCGDRFITNPQPNDVIFGKGKSRFNGGNVKARELVKKSRAEYERANRFQKTAIADDIVKEIASCGGRFLKRADDISGSFDSIGVDGVRYVRVDHLAAREKIAKFFRQLRSR